MAAVGCFQPIWSDKIHEEWKRNLLKNRSDLSASSLAKTIEIMDTSFENANVSGFESLIDGLHLPDKDHRHVLALAIHSNAQFIVTSNLKDFPSDNL